MARTILEVDARIVDANGNYSHAAGYPVPYDSRNYGDDLEGTMRRALGDAHDALGKMYKSQAGRQIQTVLVTTVQGRVVYTETIGSFPADEIPEE